MNGGRTGRLIHELVFSILTWRLWCLVSISISVAWRCQTYFLVIMSGVTVVGVYVHLWPSTRCPGVQLAELKL